GCADVLRCERRLAGARGPQPLDDRPEQLVGGPGRELDVDLTEPGGNPAAVQHRDLVVDDLTGGTPVLRAQSDPGANGTQPRGWHELGRPNVGPEEIDGRIRRFVRRPVEPKLAADEGVPPSRGRELDRPSLGVAPPEAASPAR